MFRLKNALVLACVVTITVIALAACGRFAAAKLELEAYYDSKAGFHIDYPKGWIVDQSGLLGTQVVFLNTEDDQEDTIPFRANINVVVTPSQGANLASLVRASKGQSALLFTSLKFTEDRQISVKGEEARILGSTFTLNVVHLRNIQLFVVKREKAYVITGTALETSWNNYSDLMEASLLTFAVGLQ